MREFWQFLKDEPVVMVLMIIIALVIVGASIGIPMLAGEMNRQADVCHAQHGYMVRGVCIDEKSVIRLGS